jgi:hypothetical protein
MTVALKPEVRPQWLAEEPADEAHLKALLAPYPSDGMVCWPVSARVGNVKNTIRAWSNRLFWHNRAALPDCGGPVAGAITMAEPAGRSLAEWRLSARPCRPSGCWRRIGIHPTEPIGTAITNGRCGA